MSKERQKARAAREAARTAEIEAATKARERKARRAALKPTLSLPTRRKRYGQLATREIVRLVALFLAFQVLVWFFLAGTAARASFAVLTAACLLVYVNTRRSTTR